MKFTIDRATWGRGKLCNPDGTKCALGFYYSALGASDASMLGLMVKPDGDWDIALMYGDVILANDSNRHTIPEREVRLADIFERFGVSVSFVGEYP